MYNESLISTVIYIDESVEWETYTLFVISFQIQVTVFSINLRENISSQNTWNRNTVPQERICLPKEKYEDSTISLSASFQT